MGGYESLLYRKNKGSKIKIPNEVWGFSDGYETFVFQDELFFIGGNIGLQKRIHPRFTILSEVSGFYITDDWFTYQVGAGLVVHLK